MATQLRKLLFSAHGDLRIHPVRKWVRASAGDKTIVDSRRVLLVWEPRRVVGSYAVPVEDVAGELVAAEVAAGEEHPVSLEDGPPVLDPSTPFSVHSTGGSPLTIRTADGDLPGAAFRVDDPDLAGYVVLDWEAFTQWYEEDEPVIAHPHDPFDRIDCLRSSRHIEIRHDGVLLADTTRSTLLFETPLPTRFYIPRDDVAMDLLEPTRTHTLCAYKGQASYWSARVGDTVLTDIAWSYPDPLHDAAQVRGLIAFFTERLDLVVDGEPQARPRTPWS
ncbi:MAG TPA: DUF427 domain-containing protein [Propionicimonas sp.]|uniref:DUF427 domain-containing protein n=1 Tax=Propionicimonas sp. TaxID=1955623 RepID=UPI002F4000E2